MIGQAQLPRSTVLALLASTFPHSPAAPRMARAGLHIASNGTPCMDNPAPGSDVGVLLSGGLDSSILVGHLLRQGRRVQPFYVQSGLVWQRAEIRAVRRFLRRLCGQHAALGELVLLRVPLDDLYQGHWSLTGLNPPDAHTADEAVFLPGRNALLLMKPALWCQLHGIDELALGVLGTNPFADASPGFFDAFEAVVHRSGASRVRLVRPFAGLSKRQVMEFGRDLPLELTFSCIAPQSTRHCGLCNKCAERQAAFRLVDLPDPTPYGRPPARVPSGRAAPCGRNP